MLFKFKSKACADLIMLEADGRRVLKAMIGDDPAKGIVRVEALPQALANLDAAVLRDEALRKARMETSADRADRQAGAQHEDAELPAIGLAQRAAPMQKMIRRCMAEEADLVWGV